MASNDITVGLKLTDGGTVQAVTRDAANLNKELNQTAALADKAAASFSSMQKSRAAKATLDRGVDPQALTEYNTATTSFRSGSGGSREFAAQAQGLGGLVRLYATFAANIFAVTTAYNALQNAFKTEKMVQAAEKFSGTVGTSMRSVAKSLQEVTQYSLSFQDAVKFANVGTAAGLAAKDIQNLTVIAKGAATALGRDVGESIQRIIQGTAKQEQEILDELGIFIKSKKAFEEYAKARNIKVDDLTAQQRTLAYAEAVAKAGEKWKEFATVEDPFGKLNAQLQNTLTEVLNKVNEIAVPFVKLFADSKDAILALGAFITSTLLKTALPALKDALLGAITFDKSRARLVADQLRTGLTQEVVNLTLQAENAKKKIAELKAEAIDLSSATARRNQAAGFIIPPEVLQKGSGKNTEYGLSAAKVGNAFFDPKNIENIKTFKNAQDAVLAAAKEQLGNEKTRDKVLQELIAKGVLAKESTLSNLALGKEGIVVAQKGLEQVQAQLAAQQNLNLALKEENAIRSSLSAKSSELNKAGGSSSASAPVSAAAASALTKTIPTATTQVNELTGALTKAEEAGKKMALSVASGVGGWTAAKGTFAQVGNEMAAAATNAASQGLWAQIKNIGVSLMEIPKQAAAAGAGLQGMSLVGARAGAVAAASLGAVRSALSGILAAFGPLMLAWTVWELFGNKILEFFNLYNPEVEKAKEKTKALAQELRDVTKDVSVAVTRSVEYLDSAGRSADGIVAAYTKQANALNSIIGKYEELRKAREEEKAAAEKRTPATEEFKRDPSKEQRQSLESAASVLALANSLGVSNAETQALQESLMGVKNTLNSSSSWRIGERITQGFIDLNKDTDSLLEKLPQLGKELEKIAQQNAARAKKAGDGLKGIDGFMDSLKNLDEAKAKRDGFLNAADMKAVESYKKTLEALNETRAKGTEQTNLAIDSAVSEKAGLGRLAETLMELKKPYKEVLAIKEALLAVESASEKVNRLKTGAGDVRTAALLAEAEQELAVARKNAQEQLLKGTGAVEAGVKVLSGANADANKKTSEYTLNAKRLFKELEQQIRSAELALRSMNAALEVTSKLNSFRSAFTGQQDLGNQQLAERVKLANQEYAIEVQKAALAKLKVTQSSSATPESKKAAEDEYNYSISVLGATRESKILSEQLTAIEATRNETLRQLEERQRLAADAADRAVAASKMQLDLEKVYVESKAVSLGRTAEESRYEELVLTQQGRRIELVAQEAALQRDIAAAKERVRIQAEAEIAARQKVSPGAKTDDITAARDAKFSEIDAQFSNRLEKLATEKSVQEQIMEIEERRAKLAATQASEAQKMAKFTGSLVGLFKNTGLEKQSAAITNVLKTTQSYQQKIAKFDSEDLARKEKNAKRIKTIEAQVSKGNFENAKELNKLYLDNIEEENKAVETRKELELDATIESLSAFKGMFSEKTAAYKVLDGIEKTMHAFRMISMAEQLASDIAATGTYIANSIARASAAGTEAIANQGGGDPYTAFFRMAAMAAIVSSLLGGAGKKVSVPGGMSAKDKQETQGTGMSWVNGQKVENGYGVFGDPTAKSKSISNSLEIIADNTIEGLGYDRRMLKALEAISSAIGSTAKSLYTITGIRSGSAFGTEEGTTGRGGFIGIGKNSRTTEIIDSGIKVLGNFLDVAKGLGSFLQYETVQTTTKKSGLWGIGGSTKTSFDTKTMALDKSVQDSIAQIFANATTLFETIGDKVGLTSSAIKDKLSSLNIDFEASLKGLTGKELEDALNAVISQSLDKASSMLFGEQFKKFQKFGEGLLETVVRVTDTNEKMKVAFASIGKNTAGLTIEVTEALADLTGGIEGFTESMESYRDNFLSDTEKLAGVQDNVTKVMKDLQYSTVDTREEFKVLVNSIDITTESGRKLYAELMNIAPAFAEVTAKHQELVDNYKELENELLGLFRDNAAAKALLASRETEGLSDVAKAQLERNKALQKEIDALEQYYSLLDELDQFVLTSSELRAKERASIADSNKALYDLLQAYKDRQDSEERMNSAMSEISSTLDSLASNAQNAAEGIKSAINSLVSGYQTAVSSLASAQNELANARSGLISGFFGAQDSLDGAKKGTTNALLGITRGYVNAKNAVENAQKTLNQNTKNAAKQIADNLRKIGNSLKEFLEGLVTSDLSALDATAKVKALQSQFDALYVKALGGDTDAAEKLQGVASSLLSASQETASTREDYASLFGTVTNQLSQISTNLLLQAGPEQTVDDTQTAALETLANAQAELARWQDAVNKSGADTALAEADLLSEWKTAKEAEEKAYTTFEKWSRAVSDALGFTPTEREDPTIKAINDAKKAYTDAIAKVGASEADVAAYQTALLQVGITDLSNLSQYTNNTRENIEKYLNEWRKATADQAVYAAKYAEAQELAKSISLVQVDEIAALKKSIEEYNEAADLYKKSDDIIKNSSLENIRKAIEDAQAGIISAIDANAKAVVTVTKDKEEGPTVKIPRDPASTTTDTTAPPPNVGVDPGSFYVPPWVEETSDIYRSFRDLPKVQEFASGGDHMGGLRLVGENGPELELTGPSRIYNAEKTQSLLEQAIGSGGNNDSQVLGEMVQELRSLRLEVSALKTSASQTEVNTRKAKDILEVVTQGGDSIRTESV